MKVDGAIGFFSDISQSLEMAKNQEQSGYDGIWSPETGHDPFLQLALASQVTEKIELGTGIAVAFARNPMNLAILGNDLQLISKGRFLLGLGSQVKAHIEKRFSMPWSHPAPRMRELILAMRAIWDSWNNSSKLDFRGEFYTHTLMTPFFSPGPNKYGPPQVFLAAVGGLMAEVAGEVADGLLAHGFTTPRYMKEVTIPAVEKGLNKAGKERTEFQISYPAFIVTGTNDQEKDNARTLVKNQIAFYGSTPSYRPVLELHGWGELQSELHPLSKQGKWAEMGELITDEVLNEFAVVADIDKVASEIKKRFGSTVDRISFYAPYHMDADAWRAIVNELKQD
jgi:probable F420-dependent oxidoreductase